MMIRISPIRSNMDFVHYIGSGVCFSGYPSLCRIAEQERPMQSTGGRCAVTQGSVEFGKASTRSVCKGTPTVPPGGLRRSRCNRPRRRTLSTGFGADTGLVAEFEPGPSATCLPSVLTAGTSNTVEILRGRLAAPMHQCPRPGAPAARQHTREEGGSYTDRDVVWAGVATDSRPSLTWSTACRACRMGPRRRYRRPGTNEGRADRPARHRRNASTIRRRTVRLRCRRRTFPTRAVNLLRVLGRRSGIDGCSVA
jgi:hypothetical protein